MYTCIKPSGCTLLNILQCCQLQLKKTGKRGVGGGAFPGGSVVKNLPANQETLNPQSRKTSHATEKQSPCAESLQLCPTLWPCGHGILQTRMLEWVAMPSSRGSFWTRNRTRISYISCVSSRVLYHQCDLGSPIWPCDWLKSFSGFSSLWIKTRTLHMALPNIIAWPGSYQR